MRRVIRKILYVAGCIVLPIAWGLLVEAATPALAKRSRSRGTSLPQRKGER